MVPLVAPCHVVAASVWDCDNCIPVVELLGCAANRELPARSNAHILTTLVDHCSILGCRQITLMYIRTCSFTPFRERTGSSEVVNEQTEDIPSRPALRILH